MSEAISIYKVYTKRNLADTCRDPDEYVYTHLAHKSDLDDAVKVAKEYIAHSFVNKETTLRKGEGNVIFRALDFCSYGATIIVERIDTGL